MNEGGKQSIYLSSNIQRTLPHVQYQIAECPQLNKMPGVLWLATEQRTHSALSPSTVDNIQCRFYFPMLESGLHRTVEVVTCYFLANVKWNTNRPGLERVWPAGRQKETNSCCPRWVWRTMGQRCAWTLGEAGPSWKRGKMGPRPARRGRRRAVGIGQWRRWDVCKMSEGVGDGFDMTPKHPYAQSTYHCVCHVHNWLYPCDIIVNHFLLCLSVSGE